MATHRIHKTKDFTVMSNVHLRDMNLSLKAKGLLSIMLSLPENWDYSTNGLIAIVKDGEATVRTSMKELEANGYLNREAMRGKNGRIIDWVYHIYEVPQMSSNKPEKPHVENQHVESPHVGNQGQLNTYKSNTKESITEEWKKESASADDPFIEETKDGKKRVKRAANFDTLLDECAGNYMEEGRIRELLGEWLKVRKAKRAAMTDTAITLNLNKLDRLAQESGMSVPQYLEEVIARGWAAFFPIREYGKPQAKKSPQSGSQWTQAQIDEYNRNASL